MKAIGKKILTGTMIASFVLGVGFVGVLHNQALAASTSSTTSTTSSTSVQGQDGRGHGGHFFGGNVIKETATILGVEEAAIKTSLQAGKTLAEIAEASGLTEADYLQKLIAAETTAINEKVTAGKLTQDQADKAIAGLSDQLTKQIENKGFDGKDGFPGGDRGMGFGGINLVEQTATLLSVDKTAVEEALQAGKTLAAFAQEKGLSEADYLQKLVAAETTSINAQVTAGKLTQAQADKMLSGLSDRLTKQIEGTGPVGGPEGGHGGHRGPGGMGFGSLDVAATILGVTQDELRTELEAGKSIVDLATAKGISEDDLISKIKEGMTDSIKKFVEDKHTPPAGDATAPSATPAAQ